MVEDARRRRVPGHARRHRLAHDDGQRPRRARLGRRRDRGRGGDARRAALDARAAGRRLPSSRGELPEGATATDLVLTVTRDPAPDRRRRQVRRVLRPRARRRCRSPTARRSGTCRPEYGATCGFFPVDEQTLELPAPDRPPRRADRARRGLLQGEPALARARARSRRTRRSSSSTSSTVEPSLAGPRRPQDRVPLARREDGRSSTRSARFGVALRRTAARQGGRRHVPGERPDHRAGARRRRREPEPRRDAGRRRAAADAPARPGRRRGRTSSSTARVVIAAITSCTNTSNPQVMVGAGLLAKKAVERGLAPQAVGEVEPRARLEGRDRVLRARRPDAVPRGARLPHGRLRLHDLHRQLGPAAGADLGGGRRGRPRRLRGALGQPQLRGAHPPGGEGELPRLAAARRRLRARGPDGHRPRRPSRSARAPTATTSTCATSGRARPRSQETIAGVGPRRDVPRDLRRRLHRRRARGATLPVPEGDLFAWDAGSTYVRQPPYFEGMPPRAGRGRGRRGRALPRHARRLGHDRPHLARRLDQARLARPAAT